MSESGKGKIISEETKQKMSEWQIGRKLPDETKRKLSEAGKGKKHSEETKQKISESCKGVSRNLGKRQSEEHKRKLSEIKKNRIWINNGFKRKCVNILEIDLYLFQGYKKGKKIPQETTPSQKDSSPLLQQF